MSLARPGLILQHGDDGPAGHLGDWLVERGIPASTCKVWEAGVPTAPGAFPWICSLGSEYTPGRQGSPAWVDAEIDFLRRGLASEVPILGLCFGGQTLAAAAGASVHPAEPEEVGWMRIETFDPGRIPAGPWLHFHYDQLELPDAATELARSPAGTAAFSLGASLGVQFHPEVTGEIVSRWAELDGDTLKRLGISAEDLAREAERSSEGARRDAWQLFDAWWAGLGAATR
ncbi:MAG: type 1 glutamine amidotransferase [Actinomycetota bacterium]|nr:type 1 glutamine amidotransferase [Actinomycetota bacterium]